MCFSLFLVSFVSISFQKVSRMSSTNDEGLASVRDLFASDSDVSIEEVMDDVSSGVGSSVPVEDDSTGSRRVVCSTPVRKEVRDTPKKKVVRVVAPRPRSMVCEARFSGGSLDRRAGGYGRSRKGSVDSPAGDLELPLSRTWSNGPRSGRVRERFGTAGSWDTCPVEQVDIDEAIAVKGRRNNRAIAEQMVGECLYLLVVDFSCFVGVVVVVFCYFICFQRRM